MGIGATVLPFAFAAAGSLAGPTGLALGWTIGSALGAYLNREHETQTVEQGKLSDLTTSTSTYGETIPRIWGTMRIATNAIELGSLRELRDTRTKDGVKTITYTYVRPYAAFAVCGGPITWITKVWANEKFVSKWPYGGSQTATSPAWLLWGVVLGDESQLQSSVLNDPDYGNIPLTDLPAYRGIAYIVYGDWHLNDFGGQTPSISVIAQSTASGTTTLDVVVSDICLMAGLTAGQIDVTALSSITVRGVRLSQQVTARSLIEQLQSVYFFDIVETAGKLVFTPRAQGGQLLTIPVTDLIPHDAGELKSAYVIIQRKEETSLPRRVELTYLSPTMRYDQHTKRAERYDTTSKEVVSIDVPIALDHDEAQTIADKILNLYWQERDTYTWTTGLKYLWLNVGDVVGVATGSMVVVALITEMRIDLYRSITFTGVMHAPAAYSYVAPPGDSPAYTDSFLTLGSTTLIMLDTAIVNAAHNIPSWYVGVLRTDPDTFWPEGDIYDSANDLTYTYKQTLSIELTYGVASSTLGNGPYLYWDDVNTITITLYSGSLSSTTKEAVEMSYVNLAAIGDELIQFTTVTSLGGSSYRLSGLLRGRFGTEWAVGDHGAAEVFALMDTMELQSIPISSINAAWYWKAVTAGEVEGDVVGAVHTNTGKALTPYAPHVWNVYRLNSIVYVWWQRRTRYNGEWLDYVDVPLGEDTEYYRVTFTQNALSVVYYSSTQEFDIDETDLTTAGFDVGELIAVTVAQYSATVGYGRDSVTTWV